MKDLTALLAIQHSELKSQFSLKYIAQKWHTRNKIIYLNIQWTDLRNQGRVRNQREENFWEMLVAIWYSLTP